MSIGHGHLKAPRDIWAVLPHHAPPVLDEIYDRHDRLEEKQDASRDMKSFSKISQARR
jgi:hypothetical protein